MTWVRTWQTVFGMMALLAALALTSPGVQLARAGEGDASATVSEQDQGPVTPAPEPGRVALPSEGPVCRAAAPESQPEVAVLRLQQQLAAQMAALRAAPDGQSSQPEGMMLNNRGYSYGSAPAR